MNELVAEWRTKAEADFATACREMKVTENANYDAVCFHAQQCIEKLLKAALLQERAAVPKTHDLAYLGRLLSEACVAWAWPDWDLRYLSRAAVEFRYPGESATGEDAEKSLALCGQIRARIVCLLDRHL